MEFTDDAKRRRKLIAWVAISASAGMLALAYFRGWSDLRIYAASFLISLAYLIFRV